MIIIQIFSGSLPFFKRFLFRVYAQIFRVVDRKSVSHIDHIVANSQNVQMRIKQFHNHESEVIYPPIDIFKILFF